MSVHDGIGWCLQKNNIVEVGESCRYELLVSYLHNAAVRGLTESGRNGHIEVKLTASQCTVQSELSFLSLLVCRPTTVGARRGQLLEAELFRRSLSEINK